MSDPPDYNIEVWSKIKQHVFDDPKNMLLYSAPGKGKSYWLNKIQEHLIMVGANYEMCSTTGSSSLALKGKTIHSFGSLGICNKTAIEITSALKGWHPALKKMKECEILVVDEISMLGKKTLELLDNVLKIIRKSDKPMGGLQCVFCGDFLQIQPVNDEFAFRSKIWSDLKFQPIKLTKPFRFTDQRFCEMLDRCRLGQLSTEDKQLLLNCKTTQKELDEKKLRILPTFMFPHRIDCDKMNYEKLAELPSELYLYKSEDKYQPKGKTISDYAKQNLEKQLDRMIASVTPLKENCQVMLISNMMDIKLSNGSKGVVTQCYPDSVDVLFLNKQTPIRIGRRTFETETMSGKALRCQLPLIIAFSSTINKSQGASLDSIFVNLTKVFSNAMSYVALSRTRSFKNLYIEDIDFNKIQPSQEALEFEQELDEKADIIKSNNKI